MQAAIREVQDAVVVMAHLEKGHTKRLKDHAPEIAELAEFRRRTEQNLAEITDKLNGLIGYIDNQKH